MTIEQPERSLQSKSRQTLLVTDSGLGGLSVFADLARRLEKASVWPQISMVYFNAWPEPDRGYNHFPDMNERARVFDNALNAMAAFKPDIIAIACNTLSVIYPFTAFSRSEGIPVRGIIQDGVELIRNHMTDPGSMTILFGTPTTIAAGTHRQALKALGIAPDRILDQACVGLAGKIERDPFSTQVDQMIRDNVSQAAEKLSNHSGTVYAALCCTHFGYRRDSFHKELNRHIQGKVIILNPNEQMAREMVPSSGEHTQPSIDMTIVSRVPWEPSRIKAYCDLIRTISPAAARALAGYQLKPDLFAV
ncbi:MAG: aspartate/glutamate racemase family protein [Pseudomonadota bacterium]